MSTDITAASAWWRLVPAETSLHEDKLLLRISEELQREHTQRELHDSASEQQYPSAVLGRLRERGLGAFFSEPQRTTAWHVHALNELMARSDGSLAITVGVNVLALLPIWVAADPAMRAYVADRVQQGAAGALLLTELAHGSNLARNELRAEPGRTVEGRFVSSPSAAATCYRLNGEKHLINGASQHSLLVVLARTRAAAAGAGSGLAALADFSLFLVDREHDEAARAGLQLLPRWQTLPAQGADIGGVRFVDALVPAGRMIGAQGSGLLTINRSLQVSRGAIGALAAGAGARALQLSAAWAQARNVYGAPIVELSAISEHLLRADLAATACAALSIKAAAMVNALGQRAATITAAAKVACCVLAEEAVTEGRRVLGSRALLRENPYERLVRDVMLYTVFDGTSHVMLEQLAARLGRDDGDREQASSLRELGACYREPPRNLVDVLAARAVEPLPLALGMRARALASAGDVDASDLVPLSRALLELVAALRRTGLWNDQAHRFHVALTLSFFEALLASLELADPARRRALGVSADALHTADVRRTALLLAWLGGRIARRIRELALSCDLAEPVVELDGVERRLRRDQARLTREYKQQLTASVVPAT